MFSSETLKPSLFRNQCHEILSSLSLLYAYEMCIRDRHGMAGCALGFAVVAGFLVASLGSDAVGGTKEEMCIRDSPFLERSEV